MDSLQLLQIKAAKKKSGESTKSSPGDNHSQTTMQISRRDLISLAAERPLAISTYEGTRTLFTLFSCVSHLFGGTCFYDCHCHKQNSAITQMGVEHDFRVHTVLPIDRFFLLFLCSIFQRKLTLMNSIRGHAPFCCHYQC